MLLLSGSVGGEGAVGGGSAAGGEIAFSSSRGANWDIYVMDANGSGVRRLTRNPAEDDRPAWSADGRKIAFVSGRAGDGIYLMKADGSGLRRLLRDAAFPAWSPDGKEIAFLSDRGGNYDIYVMGANGGSVRDLTRNPAGYQAIGRPAWSPDGSKLAFDRGRLHGGDEHIYLMNADGSGQRELTRTAGTSRDLAWSPRGGAIAYASDLRGNFDIYLLTLDGHFVRRLTSRQAEDTAPTWSPDGRRIAFSRGSSVTAIYVMNADGSGQRKLMNAATNPAWQPAARPRR